MKKIFLIFCMILLLFSIVGCGNKNSNDSKKDKIKMPQSSEFYKGDAWTLESLTNYFKELGFTNIEGVACSPDDDDYQSYIFSLDICTGLFSEGSWEKGEEFKASDKIEIYFNESPMLTIENCKDLKNVLTSDDIPYIEFAEKYDERYIQFKAIVSSHITYNSGMDHIIDVKGKGGNGLEIRVGNRTLNNKIDESVEEGDKVVVRGKISESQSEYFKQLYVETLELEKI